MCDADIVIVGGGAAGLATAIFAARAVPQGSVLILDGARRLGAKILVSGGGRCNVTNTRVTAEDFRGGSRNTIRRVLRQFPVPETVAFFQEIGVRLHEEENGKVFPDSNSARTVLDALLREVEQRGVRIRTKHRVVAIDRGPHGFAVQTSAGPILARRVVLGTGGLSLPKTGSDGGGYALARALGHSIVPTTPALVPLVLEGEFHKGLSGVAHPAALTVRSADVKPQRLTGSMLWTHFGVSGPVVLDASGLWHRSVLADQDVRITANLLGDETLPSAEQWLAELALAQPKLALHNALAGRRPAKLVDAVLAAVGVPGRTPLAHLSRDHRRRVLGAMLAWALPVRDSRGYQYAEVTAGGVSLDEIDPGTMESRRCPGLHLVGEILDVDGRIGGFNFQWAWASGRVAGEAAARANPVDR